MKRTPALVIACAAALTLSACKDVGLDVNIPVEEAATRPQSQLMAAVHAPPRTPVPPIVIDGRRWVASGFPLQLVARDLQPIGAATGETVYARKWDSAPYDEVFTQAPPDVAASGTTALEAIIHPRPWLSYAPVVGRTGPVPARAGD